MATSVLAEVIRHIGRLAGLRGDLATPDEQLLRRFIDTRDEAAFTAIVSRHGPMVLGVCRQLLRDPNDVDDGFQATFLVLVRKARSVRMPELLGNWLYGVAYKVAARARANTAKRRTREGQENDIMAFPAASVPADADLRSLIHEEVHRLPDKYRGPVVLCFLENKTHEEAAQTLRWPIGSVKGRLARAKELLRSRLARRGATLSAGAIAATLTTESASAALPATVLQTTVKAALAFAAGKTVAGGLVSAHAVALSEGVIQTMFWNKMKFAAALVLSLSVLGGGAGVLAYQRVGKEPDKKAEQPKVVPKEADKPEEDIKALQGNWRVVSVRKNGREVSGDEIEKMKDARWSFSEGKLSFVTQESETRFSLYAVGYQLNVEQMPKEMEIFWLNNQGESTGKLNPAIYSLEGDTLKICTAHNFSAAPDGAVLEIATQRPTSFVTKNGDNTMLITLQCYKGANEYDYPDAKSKDSSTMASRLHQSQMLSDDDIESVRKWYETKFDIEHDGELGHHGTRGRANGDVVSQVANDSTDQHNGVTTARPVKVYFLTQDTHYHWVQIVLTRAEGEKQTHIVITFVPKK